jgi:hypothetical protein
MASARDREVREGVQYQGEDEVIAYSLDTSQIGVPSAPVVVVKNAAGADVTGDVMPVNVPTVADSVITLSPLSGLTAGQRYRVEVKYVVGGNTLENYFYVEGQE